MKSCYSLSLWVFAQMKWLYIIYLLKAMEESKPPDVQYNDH